MTTVGVRADPSLRAMPLHIPSYSYQYPSLRRVQLAAVKQGLFHPRLPTIRRMDMDTASHKLPDEHCRTTTTCTSLDFQRAATSMYSPPADRQARVGISENAKEMYRSQTAPTNTSKTRADWSDFLNRCPERFQIQLPPLPSKDQMHFQGYAVRYLQPEISSYQRPVSESAPGFSRQQEQQQTMEMRQTPFRSLDGCSVCVLMSSKKPAGGDMYNSVYNKHICMKEKEKF